MVPIRFCEERDYGKPVNDNPFLPYSLLSDLTVTINGIRHPELRDFDAILNYFDENGLMFDSIRYFSEGKEWSYTGHHGTDAKLKFDIVIGATHTNAK